MTRKQIGLAVAGVVAAGTVAIGGVTIASAASTPTPGASSSSGAAANHGTPGTPAQGMPGGHAHTPVTGTELDKVKAAVKAKDPAVSVTSVQQDPDGSYDAFGTKAGAQVRVEVSKDLATVTVEQGGKGGRGPGGGGHDTAVTGAEADKVKAAVKAKDSAVTVTEVRKDPDGSYDAVGTKAGAPVFLDVSKDLRTITQGQGGQGGKGGHGGPEGGTGGTSSGSLSGPSAANGTS